MRTKDIIQLLTGTPNIVVKCIYSDTEISGHAAGVLSSLKTKTHAAVLQRAFWFQEHPNGPSADPHGRSACRGDPWRQ